MKKLKLSLMCACFLSVFGATAQTTIQFEIDQPTEPLLVDAGMDQAYDGVATIVLGGAPTATGAFGNYTYSWTPAEFLDDPTVPNPTVINLVGPTAFTVLVTADGALCEKTEEVFVDDITVGIEDNMAKQIQVFPNPFTHQVRFEANMQVANVVVHDIAGNRILMKNQPDLLNGFIDASALEAGMYFFTFEFLNDNQTTLKLCKLY